MFGWFKRKPRMSSDRENIAGQSPATLQMHPNRTTALSDLFVHGELHSPYFIFLKCAVRYCDGDLLLKFGLSGFHPTNAVPFGYNYAILADGGEWTLIADDWYYTLWHLPSTRTTIAAIGQTCDVFACSIGDCDRSFDFIYYRDSQLVRRYVVEDPHFQGGVVVADFGEPLPGEAAAFKQADQLKLVLAIAASLGIKTEFNERDIRVYAAPRTDGALFGTAK